MLPELTYDELEEFVITPYCILAVRNLIKKSDEFKTVTGKP